MLKCKALKKDPINIYVLKNYYVYLFVCLFLSVIMRACQRAYKDVRG